MLSSVAAAVVLPLLLMLALWGRTKIWNIVHEMVNGTRKSHGYFSLERAAFSYAQYRAMSLTDAEDMRSSYAKLGRVHKRIGYDLGYPRKLSTLQETIARNALVTEAIADLAARDFPGLQPNAVDSGDLGRVRETLKHFVRDWSAEGARERDVIFTPILDALQRVPPDQRADMHVLVPGAGLGRLAWEISQLGYRTTANELSYFMTLAFRFLASPSTTHTTEQHTICPYAYWFSHQRTNAALFRPVTFPDAVPRLGPHLRLAEGDFLALAPPHGTPGFDAVVTLFFVDTSLNAIATIEHIYALLRPGGRWINLGPLLWPGGAQARVELSLDEVLHLSRLVGFEVEGDGRPVSDDAYRRKTVECEYTGDAEAMMKYIYRAEYWVARKPT